MNLICLFLCNLILIHGCLTANINHESPRNEIQRQNKSEIKVDALNEDFLFAIFDESDVEDLLQFSQNPRVSVFVKKHVFPIKYQNYSFHIVGSNNVNPQRIVEARSKSISIQGYDLFLEIITIFGESIPKLDIRNSELISDERSAEIFRYINEYCAESLTTFSTGFMKENTLLQFEKPFSNLEDLTIDIGLTQVNSSRAFNEIFPKLQRLSLIFIESTKDIKFIEGNLADLDHLHIIVGHHLEPADIVKQIKPFLEENQQIRSLIYEHRLDNSIQVISSQLPNLEHLRIAHLDSDIQPVHFDSVKHFYVGAFYQGPIDRIYLPHLQSLTMVYGMDKAGSERDSWMTFLRNHSKLKQLVCTLCSLSGIEEFLGELKDLNELRIRYHPNFDIELTTRLIENHKNLSKFQFQAYSPYRPDKPDLAIYQKEFGNEWNISYIEGNWPTLTLEKKFFD